MGTPAGHVAIYMSVRDWQQSVGALNETTRAVDRLGAATNRYGAKASWSRQKIFLWNQAMFTVRRAAYGGTLAMIALTGAAVKMGFSFNAAMESNRLAFEQFLGSTKAANKELGYLYNLAKYTPFEFSNVTEAARRFLAFGYTLKQTNENLKVIGDTVAAFGGGADQIQRMTLVFGQIRASGRLLGQDMLQLEQQGIPVMDILVKQLGKYGITRKQLGRVGALGIPSEIGVPALLKGMNQLFGGAAARQAKSFNGQISTLHDNLSQLFGALTFQDFNKLRTGLLPGLNRMFGDIGNVIQKQKGLISIDQVLGIAQKHYPGLTLLIDYLKRLYHTARTLGTIFMQSFLPAIMDIGLVISYTVLPVVILLSHSLNILGHHVNILRIIITYLIAVYTIEKGLLIAKWIWERRLLTLTILRWGWTKLVAIVTFTYNLIKYRSLVLDILMTKATWKYNAALKSLVGMRDRIFRFFAIIIRGQKAIMTGPTGAAGKWSSFEKVLLRVRYKAIAMWQAFQAGGLASWFSNPYVLLAAAIVAIIVALVILYIKWKWFHDHVNATGRWIIQHWKLVVAAIATINPPLAFTIFIVAELIKHFRRLVNWARDAWGWIKKVWNFIPGHRIAGAIASTLLGGGGGMPVTGGHAGGLGPQPAFAGAGAGGRIRTMPAGLAQMGRDTSIPIGGGAAGAPGYVQLNNTIQIDGKTIARQTAKYKLDAEARQ